MAATPPRRAMRADAAANRERILSAAGAEFATRGIGVPIGDIAAAAGVGVGTLYRHFTDRDAIVRALYDRLIEHGDGIAAEVLAQPDGWSRIQTYIRSLLDVLFANPWAGTVMERMRQIDPRYQPGINWEEPVAQIIAQAKAEGSLRLDAESADISTVVLLLAPLGRLPEPVRSRLALRHLTIVLDGLRAGPREDPLPDRALNADEFDRLAHTRGASPR